jgi:hypothetical protein
MNCTHQCALRGVPAYSAEDRVGTARGGPMMGGGRICIGLRHTRRERSRQSDEEVSSATNASCAKTRICLFGFNVRFCTIKANWTRLPGGHRLGGRRRQTKYNAHTLVTSLPRKVTHITQSSTNNANRKHNDCYQSDTSYSLN